jgi:hypothetical protein
LRNSKERYFVVLRKSMATRKTPEIDKILEIFSGYGEVQEGQLEAAMVSMVKARDQDAEVSWAVAEFYRVQKVEDQFHKDFDGLDST